LYRVTSASLSRKKQTALPFTKRFGAGKNPKVRFREKDLEKSLVARTQGKKMYVSDYATASAGLTHKWEGGKNSGGYRITGKDGGRGGAGVPKH